MNTNNITHTDTLVGGRYRLTTRLADGGMAVVYRAVDEVLGRLVAVKLMRPGLAGDDAFGERFRREAQNAAALSHPNIVTIHDWGRDAGAVFMVMELVEGETLRDLMRRSGPLPLTVVRTIVAAVCAALDHAHARGIVHRDVKPENVLLSWSGDGPPSAVKLADFGIARALAEQSRLTAGAVVGTMTYIAPEQLGDSDAGPAADVYALGVMTFELLTGRPPFEGDSPAAVAAARLTRSVPSPGVSPRVDGAIARATAMRPEDRFPSAGELAEALGDDDNDTVATPYGSLPVAPLPTQVLPASTPPSRPRRRRRLRRVTGTLLVVALVAAGAVGVLAAVMTTVPGVAGRPIEDARRTLERAGLAADQLQVFDEAGAGMVLRSSPASGSRVRRGTHVRVVVSRGPEMIAVPAIVGRTLDDASAALVQAGFVVGETSEAFSAERPKGAVVSQTPADGTARRGAAVALVVSKGPELVVVPDVAKRATEDAKAAMRTAGLVAATSGDWSEDVPEGQVVRTDPAAGRPAPKGSRVTLVVSRGPKPFAMPNVVGLDIGEARSKLAALGLVLGNQYAVPGSGKPKGQVQGQNPPAGTSVRKGARVDLYYAV